MRKVYFQTVTGQNQFKWAKCGPTRKPAELLRPSRVIGSVSARLRAELDDEIARGPFSESDLLAMGLRMVIDLRKQERELYGLLYSSP
ncbi:hypothetical protein [Caudoviricetes sp.]|nr:hypothetical protein [Caudoviricetes sp.]UOF81104.1 hypothetical protein [Caudoviricetes sp.]UOF82215.1 hypothetical protein [Caudoviricetes sp.]UOF82449.1 hypothetical protein [Caudoviricetes sp.]UOF82648.1 hypothetical protein [Caudoviricetes sp.]